MIKTSRQLKDLINNLARKNAADAQLLMRNYMMERFLERVSLSQFRENFILKGGMLVAAMVGLDTRSTMDIDATVRGAAVDVDHISDMISEIISVPVKDGVFFSLKSVSEIMDEAEYPGGRPWRRCSMGCALHLRLIFLLATQSRREKFSTVFI